MKLKFLAPVIGSLLFAGFLVGCSEEKAKTVEYYKQNIPEAETRSKECKAAKELTQMRMRDCENASAALYAESFKKGTGTHNLRSLEESKKELGF
ncbi:EexN family lipoprotein [Campylobacter fetus]|uniref:EexN family lipoprotein n=1 Tax=Campylobacter fetus TaxID=196 RepID=UPI000A91A5A0|nr:EexN family lipoprotein [Campylobacter fetus]